MKSAATPFRPAWNRKKDNLWLDAGKVEETLVEVMKA
jgi:hypothetical protein